MEIFFGTKDENNLRREEEFLKLSPAERLEDFFCRLLHNNPLYISRDKTHPNDIKGNFIIRKN